MLPYLVLVIPYLAVAFCMFMMRRTTKVYEFRRGVIDTVYELSGGDVHKNKEWRWRWDAFETVDFGEMVNKFWRPLTPEEWWKDTSFLKP
jgi:hypothetical protein